MRLFTIVLFCENIEQADCHHKVEIFLRSSFNNNNIELSENKTKSVHIIESRKLNNQKLSMTATKAPTNIRKVFAFVNIISICLLLVKPPIANAEAELTKKKKKILYIYQMIISSLCVSVDIEIALRLACTALSYFIISYLRTFSTYKA